MNDDTPRPRAARAYEEEEAELIYMINAVSSDARPMDDAVQWLDTMLYEHRAKARAEGWQECKDHYFWGRWWDRNWFPVLMITIIVGGMVLIGLVNGWS